MANVTFEHLEEALALLIDQLTENVIVPMRERIIALESRTPSVKYGGVFRPENAYTEGELVTHQGGLWLATSAKTRTPGQPDSGWTLVVKRGSA